MNNTIHRHILLPLYETVLKRRGTMRYWRGLERTQWLSSQPEIETLLQFQALRPAARARARAERSITGERVGSTRSPAQEPRVEHADSRGAGR